ncbi:MAG: LysM peptidoglycan-binding domain-containing M23 family metallopeptidase [Alphaproteobacteria bacterium]|nr:LysM peptidoglycan-binding domain-containing M23 family metallopeptidase [Alphaproteobacteria bacterium]
MRISVPIGAFAVSKVKFVFVATTAMLLAGCSSSIERFAADYSNPSDADPVYTASVPKYKKVAARRPISQNYVAPQEEVIAQSPIVQAPLNKSKAQAYDYSKAYKSAQNQPQVAYNAAPSAPADAPQPYKAPVYKQPKFDAPVGEETIADSTQQPVVKAPVYKQVASAAAPTQPLYKKPTAVAPKLVYRQAATPVVPAEPAAAPAGNTVTVGPGMTLFGIAKANHLTTQQLAAANNLKLPYSVRQGQVLRIPASTASAMPDMAIKTRPVSLASEEQVTAPASKPFAAKAGTLTHTVASGDTLFSIGRQYGVAPSAVAELNKLSGKKNLQLGQALKIPTSGKATVAQADVATEAATNDAQVADNSDAAANNPVKKPAALALPKEQPQADVASADSSSDAAPLALRWPLKGKVISAFGAKPNGLKNEGINIAVPEGTNIQAADAGVVAYAGNELKGYGNLILIRHAGGFVTAYAHASQLLVKRGDTVKRGDVIAKAGQTGAVQSPQLHFEVRKGATALDPNKFLTSSTASN